MNTLSNPDVQAQPESTPESPTHSGTTGVMPAPRPVTLELIAQASVGYVTPHLANPEPLEKAMRRILRRLHHPLSVMVNTVSRQTDVLSFPSSEGVSSRETQRLSRSFFDALGTPGMDSDGCLVTPAQQLQVRKALFSRSHEGEVIHRLMRGNDCVLTGVRVEGPLPPQVDNEEEKVAGTLEAACLRRMTITVLSAIEGKRSKRETFNVHMKEMSADEVERLKDLLIWFRSKNLLFAALARTDKRRLVDGRRLLSILASIAPGQRDSQPELRSE